MDHAKLLDVSHAIFKNEFDFWKVHEIMNLPKIEFIAYIYILYYQSSINFQFSPDLAGFPDILN